MKVVVIIGARPQFIKHFPFERACRDTIELITVHTGQHYDENMSDVFFTQFGMSKPAYQFNNGGGEHGEQTAKMMIDIENVVLKEKPHGIVVYGDTNSTLAGALVAAKLHIPVYHIEAGLRSYNKQMPEEVNRVLTDHISYKLFVTSDIAVQNLSKEGICENVFMVGDVMKDVILIVNNENKIGNKKYDFDYYYITIHRPYNTDNPERLQLILNSLDGLSKRCVIAMHPRTRNLLVKHNIFIDNYKNLTIIEPQGYFENLNHLTHSNGLITDSGGMQKEAYWLQKKCVTIRTETEWTETVILGGNKLLFEDLSALENSLNEQPEAWNSDLYGNGNAAKMIVDEIVKA